MKNLLVSVVVASVAVAAFALPSLTPVASEQMRGWWLGRFDAKRALAAEGGYDAIHDTVHEMAKDEARHGAGFTGLYNRYFK